MLVELLTIFSFGSCGVQIGPIRFFAVLRATYLMETPGVDQGQMKPGRVTKNSSTQTDCKIEGEPRRVVRKQLIAEKVNTVPTEHYAHLC